MSFASVRAFLADHAPDLAIIDGHASTATVADAAAALGVPPARIAKTLSVTAGGAVMLLVMRGDARLDNRKARDALGAKPRMLDAAAAEAVTGHPVGGVCPFGLATPLPVYLDISMRAFGTVFPAAGSRTASVEMTPARLAELTAGRWVDVCRMSEPGGGA